jgi:hypothetical protein
VLNTVWLVGQVLGGALGLDLKRLGQCRASEAESGEDSRKREGEKLNQGENQVGVWSVIMQKAFGERNALGAATMDIKTKPKAEAPKKRSDSQAKRNGDNSRHVAH